MNYYCSLSLCGKTTGCDPEEFGSSPRDCTTIFKNSVEDTLENVFCFLVSIHMSFIPNALHFLTFSKSFF